MLDFDSAIDGIGGALELHQRSVAGGLKDAPAVLLRLGLE
jgi:hypothetical protein